MAMKDGEATFYVQLEPVISNYGNDVVGVKATRLNTKKPKHPLSGSVTIKLTVRVPLSVFLPLEPEAIVIIPSELTEHAPIEVIAQEPE